MSARRRQRKNAAPARPRRGGMPPRLLAGLVVLAAIIVIGALVVRMRRAGPPGSPPPAATVPDSLAGLRPDSAFARARAIEMTGRPDLSLALFRYALSHRGAPLVAHVDYSDALHNAALQTRSHFGLQGPAVRSSVERVALLRESLAELDVAEQMKGTPADQALVHATRGHHFLQWGLPWDALRDFSRAQALDPSNREYGAMVARITSQLRHPGPGADS